MSAIFSITPVSQQISLQAGQTFSGAIKVTNPNSSDSNLNYQVSILPYTIVDESYKADLLTETRRTEITKWVSFPEPSGTLAPNETTEVPFTISVPENAPAGGQYAAIVISSQPSSSASSSIDIGSIYELSSVIYAEVAGTTIHDGVIESLAIPKFSVGSPTISATVKNAGNIHDFAQISLSVTNLLNDEEIYATTDTGGPFQEIIIPETTRLITRKLDNLPALGLFRITEQVTFGSNTKSLDQTILVAPLWFLLLLSLTVLAILSTIVTIIFKKHAKKKGILKV